METIYDNLVFTLKTLRDHMIDTTKGFEIVDQILMTHAVSIGFAFMWLIILTIMAWKGLFKTHKQGEETMHKGIGIPVKQTNCSETTRELGWSFKVIVEVQGPGGEGAHRLIAEQENTHREYAEFIQKGMPAKYAELNEEFKNR